MFNYSGIIYKITLYQQTFLPISYSLYNVDERWKKFNPQGWTNIPILVYICYLNEQINFLIIWAEIY